MKYFFIITTIIFGVSCTQDKVIAWVGNTAITFDHLNYIIQIEQAYENENPDTLSMIFMLIRNELQEKEAAMSNIVVTPEMLHNEAQRFKRETKAPEILKRVISIFRGDTVKYFTHYVRPVLIGQLLEQKYMCDTLANRNTSSDRDYTAWLECQAQDIPVMIKDPVLKQRLLGRVKESPFWRSLLADQ